MVSPAATGLLLHFSKLSDAQPACGQGGLEEAMASLVLYERILHPQLKGSRKMSLHNHN